MTGIGYAGGVESRASGRLEKLVLYGYCLVICIRNIVIVAACIAATCATSRAEQIGASVGRGGKNDAFDVLTVQLLLNQLPSEKGGADPMLVPDGIIGPATIGAIERFQTTALPSGVSDGRLDPGQASLAKLNELVEQQPLADRAVRVALGERLVWKDGKRQELDFGLSQRLKYYWATAGLDFKLEDLRNAQFQDKWPWSAAFMSWVMQQAGAGRNFKYTASHWEYVAAAKKNRLENNDNPIKAFSIEEHQVAVGDILVKRRSDSTANYGNVEQGHKTHGDIVVAIEGNEAVTVGGNVGHSVTTTKVPLDERGYVASELYFAIVKLSNPPAE